MSASSNDSARDLWGQLLKQFSKHPNAAVVDPDHDPTEDTAKLRKRLREAGWSEHQIEARVALSNAQIAAAPSTSPGVSPHAEFVFGSLCDDVEAAMVRLKLSSHARVARGIDPRLGPYAAKTTVIMTDESIVTVGAQMFRFCGLVARAFTRTLQLDPGYWESSAGSAEADARLLRRHADVLMYWAQIFLSFAITGTHIRVPFRPATIFEVGLFEQIARAMELFAVAHEYGHHHFDHGRTIESE
jgi:hypothetical protein